MTKKKNAAINGEFAHPLSKRQLPSGRRRPVAISPSLISASPYAVRLPPFNDAEYTTLVQTMKYAGKNLVPAAVRPVADGTYELLYGHRRWAAATELKIKLHCLVMTVTDADLPFYMEWENSGRMAPRPYRLGVIFRRWIEEGVFTTQKALALELDRSEGDVSNMISLAELPSFVIGAFVSPDDLMTRHAKKLKDACKQEIEVLKTRAQQVQELRANGEVLTVHEVYRILTGQ